MSQPRRLVILGASGHGRVVAAAAIAEGWEVLGFADADPTLRGTVLGRLEVAATHDEELLDWLRGSGASLILAIGQNRVRAKVFARLSARGVTWARVVHPRSWLAPGVTVGEGSVVCAGVVVQPGARVGANVILNTSCSVDHDGVLHDHCHLSPGVHLGGTVEVGEGTWLGVGVSVRNNLTIGPWATVGVGAAVVADLPADVVAVGVPARARSAAR